MMKKIISMLIVILIVISLCGCDNSKVTRYQSEYLDLFDTTTVIVGFANNQDKFNQYSQLIYDNLKVYHQLYDIYNDYDGINNIKTINENAGIKPIKVDEKIIDLLIFSKDMYKLTSGKTNIAFGSVLKIWHDYRTEGINNPDNASLPSAYELKEASLHTDIEKIIIDEENSTVFLDDSDMSLDVGAVAKGYATEQVSQIAKKNGFESGIISVGGNVCAVGKKADDQKEWSVGIQNPDLESENNIIKTVSLSDMSLVTSGDYERYYTVDGKKYNHIIDPKTLFPAEYFTSVSIICNDSGKADALSTALFCMSYEDGKKLIDSIEGAEAAWIYASGDIKYSNHFEDYLKDK